MKVLVIVYYWPPSAGSGVQRWLKLTKYMQELGSEVHVLTPSNPDFSLCDESLEKDIHPEVKVVKLKIWEPYKYARMFMGKNYSNTGTDHAKRKSGIVSSILRNIRARFFIPDPRKFWTKPAVRFLKKYLPENEIDIVITSGPPHSLHKIGHTLKMDIPGLKWIMDVRDPISQLDFVRDLGARGGIGSKYELYEHTMLQKADAVVGTSYSLPEYLEEFDLQKYYTIPNGYDEADFEDNDTQESKEIVISHAGLFNRYRFSPGLWKALNALQLGKPLKVYFAGPISDEMLEKARAYSGLGDNLVNLGYISHQDVLKLYRKSTVLLLFANKSEMGKTNIPGKIFELMATGKPVLGFGNPEGDAAQILEKSGCGKILSYATSAEDIRRYLSEIIHHPRFNRNEAYIRQFTRKALAQEYIDLCMKVMQ